MTYPQAQASQEILEGQTFFRLFTQLISSGDAYEMDASALAFCIGPQSDIARARVTYYDPTSPTKSSSFVVSVDSPFIGRIDRLGSQVYPVSGNPANILITPEDLVNNEWQPPAYNPANQLISFVKPNIDLQGFFTDPPVLPARRADFTRKGQLTIIDDGGGTGTTYLVLPYYRRKYASIKFLSSALAASAVDVVGVSFALGAPPFDAMEELIINAGVIAPTDTSAFEVRATQDGLFDYLSIQVTGPVLALLNYDITFTDEQD